MDRQIGAGTIAALVAVVVVVLGIVAWRVFGSAGPSPEQHQQQMQGIREDYMRRMPPGQAPVGVPVPGQ